LLALFEDGKRLCGMVWWEVLELCWVPCGVAGESGGGDGGMSY